MKKKFFMLVVGLLIGIAAMLLIDNYQFKKQTKYIELKENFIFNNGGFLPKGTFLKVDKSASEGYTRYILYIYYKTGSGIETKIYDKKNLVVPYWMYINDSVDSRSPQSEK